MNDHTFLTAVSDEIGKLLRRATAANDAEGIRHYRELLMVAASKKAAAETSTVPVQLLRIDGFGGFKLIGGTVKPTSMEMFFVVGTADAPRRITSALQGAALTYFTLRAHALGRAGPPVTMLGKASSIASAEARVADAIRETFCRQLRRHDLHDLAGALERGIRVREHRIVYEPASRYEPIIDSTPTRPDLEVA